MAKKDNSDKGVKIIDTSYTYCDCAGAVNCVHRVEEIPVEHDWIYAPVFTSSTMNGNKPIYSMIFKGAHFYRGKYVLDIGQLFPVGTVFAIRNSSRKYFVTKHLGHSKTGGIRVSFKRLDGVPVNSTDTKVLKTSRKILNKGYIYNKNQ